jgi:hypothetical protein
MRKRPGQPTPTTASGALPGMAKTTGHPARDGAAATSAPGVDLRNPFSPDGRHEHEAVWNRASRPMPAQRLPRFYRQGLSKSAGVLSAGASRRLSRVWLTRDKGARGMRHTRPTAGARRTEVPMVGHTGPGQAWGMVGSAHATEWQAVPRRCWCRGMVGGAHPSMKALRLSTGGTV